MVWTFASQGRWSLVFDSEIKEKRSGGRPRKTWMRCVEEKDFGS